MLKSVHVLWGVVWDCPPLAEDNELRLSHLAYVLNVEVISAPFPKSEFQRKKN